MIVTSCSEIRTNNPTEVYKHWSGSAPSRDVELLNGQYWQSSHWTREYILFLNINATETWWAEFVDQNSLVIDNERLIKLTDKPKWFNPNKNMAVYRRAGSFDQGSRYFRNTETSECFIYEIQL